MEPDDFQLESALDLLSTEWEQWDNLASRLLEEGHDVPPERAAELVVALASGKADVLSGRFVSIEDDLDEMVTKRCAELEMERCDFRFTRREVREYSGFGNTRLKIHLHRLEELEYLVVHRGGRGHQFVYELVYQGEGRDGTPFLCGLLDVSKLGKHGYDANRSPLNADLSGTGRPQVVPESPPSRPQGGPVSSSNSEKIKPINGKTPKSTTRDEKQESSYMGSHTHISPPVIQAKGAE